MKKLPLLLAAAVSILSTLMTGCTHPYSDILGLRLVNDENYQPAKSEDGTISYDCDKCLKGIVVCLRNDTISGGILREAKSNDTGYAEFVFSNEKICDDIVVTDSELDRISDGTTDYYLVVNDPKSSSYNPEYETRTERWQEKGSNSFTRMVYLPKKGE